MCVVLFGCFFFQAEDGIRDLVRSRGLGDVYKRQGWGLCFDDVVLTAFAYSTDVPINNGSATIPATGSSLYTEDIALYNINTTFVESPSTIDYYDLVLYNENLILNGTFASSGYWTFSSGASLEKRAGYSFFDSSSYSVRLPVTNAEAAQLVNINGMQEYIATAYWRKYDAGSVTIKLKAETFTAAMTLSLIHI